MADTLIHSVRLFDGNKFHQNATVSFSSTTGLIDDVSFLSWDIPAAAGYATVIDGSGSTLIPGLIDGHVHCHNLHNANDPTHFSTVLTRPLKCGVTTVCDMFCNPEAVNSLRSAIEAERKEGKATMSDLKSSMYAATIDGGWPKPVVVAHHPAPEVVEAVDRWPKVRVEDAKDFVKAQLSSGADYIKLMQESCGSLKIPPGAVPSASQELQSALIQAAHDQDVLAVGHATNVADTKLLLHSGVDGLTHTFCDQAPTQEVVELYKKTVAFLIPTLIVIASITGEKGGIKEEFARIAYDKGLVDKEVQAIMNGALSVKAETAKYTYAAESVRVLKEAGIDIVAGTDSIAGLPGTALGVSLWTELSMYVTECGMSAGEALASATSVSARRFGFKDRGVVMPSRRADLVLVEGDLQDRIQHLWEGDGIVGVWKQGVRAV